MDVVKTVASRVLVQLEEFSREELIQIIIELRRANERLQTEVEQLKHRGGAAAGTGSVTISPVESSVHARRPGPSSSCSEKPHK